MRGDIIIWLLTLNLGVALSGQASSPSSCIRMTSETEKQIEKIIEKLGSFLNDLTIEHEDFDISFVKLGIERHSEDEVEEKETVLEISVNDCQNDESEVDQSEAKEHTSEHDEYEPEETPKSVEVMYLNLQENGQKIVEALDRRSPGPRLVYIERNDGQLNYLFNKK